MPGALRREADVLRIRQTLIAISQSSDTITAALSVCWRHVRDTYKRKMASAGRILLECGSQVNGDEYWESVTRSYVSTSTGVSRWFTPLLSVALRGAGCGARGSWACWKMS